MLLISAISRIELLIQRFNEEAKKENCCRLFFSLLFLEIVKLILSGLSELKSFEKQSRMETEYRNKRTAKVMEYLLLW